MPAAGDEARRVVLTGAGVISALGDTPQAFFEALCQGETAFAPVRLFELDGLPTRRAGEIADFTPDTYLGRGNFRPLDRTARLATAAAGLVLEATRWTPEQRDAQELGLVLGTMFGSVRTIAEFDRRALEAGPKYVKPFDFANSVINAAAGQTAIWHGLRGLNSTVTGGPTASLQAISYAADLVRNGRTDALLVGGVEELCFESFLGFSRAGLLCPGNGGGEECPVPLARGRNGFLLGEGVVIFLLEEAEAARRRGVEPLAVIRGHGSAFDVSRGQDPEKSARAVARALSSALADAGLSADDVDAASLSANGSVAGDRHEASGFAAAFGERIRQLPVTAIKSMLGETLGASGAFQTLALVEGLRRGVLPGIAGLAGGASSRDDELAFDAASAQSREVGMRRGVVHALGLDGNSCALVVEAVGTGTAD